MHHHHLSGSRAARCAAGVAAALLALGAAAPARADANMLLNSGFETGDLSGWTLGGDTGFTFASCGYLHAEGNCAAALGSTATGTLSQNVALAVGTGYLLTFALLGYGDNPSSFSAALNGNQFFTVSNPSTNGAFQAYQALVTPAVAASTLQLRFTDAAGFMWLDNVQLAPVPEPASALLFGLGLAGLCAAARRRA